MGYFAVVLVICFCSNFALSTSNHEQNAHHHLKEKSHEHHQRHHERFKQEHHHEKVRHHERNKLAPSVEIKEHHQSRSHFDHHVHYRDQQNQQCSWVCNGNQNAQLNYDIQVQYKSSSSLFGIVNQQSKEALIFAYDSNTVALLNGKTGSTYILDLEKNELYNLPETPGVTWDVNATSFQDYFQNLSATNLLQTAEQKGQQLDINTLPEIVVHEIEDNLDSLGLQLPLDRALPIIRNFSKSLKNGLNLLYMGNGAFDINNHVRWFITINIFIEDLLTNEDFNISNIRLDPKNLFSGATGIQVVANLFSQLARRFNFSNFITSLVNSRNKSLKLLEDLSAGSNNGLDGLLTILVHFIRAISFEESPTEVIRSFFLYNSTGVEEPTWGQVVDQFLEIMRVQSQMFPMSQGVELFIRFLQAANSNNLVINNIHIFDLVKMFFSPNPLDRIRTAVQVLSSFLPQRSIPAFFSFVRDVLTDASNSSLLNQLLPGVNISSLLGNGTFLDSVFGGGNLTSGNITSALSHIPILGQIVQQVSSAFGGQNFDPFHLQNIFSNGQNSSSPGESVNNSSDSGNILNGIGNLFGLSKK